MKISNTRPISLSTPGNFFDLHPIEETSAINFRTLRIERHVCHTSDGENPQQTAKGVYPLNYPRVFVAVLCKTDNVPENTKPLTCRHQR